MSGNSPIKRPRWNAQLAYYWDSCVILTFLKGEDSHLENVIKLAELGKIIIATSSLAEAEVAFIPGIDDDLRIIEKFFAQPYVFILPIRKNVIGKARELVRDLNLRGADAVHIATALHWNIPVFETFDQDLVKKCSVLPSAIPGLVVRQPDPTSALPGPAVMRRLPGF